MARTTRDIIQLIQTVVHEHERYWDQLRPDMQRYRRLYLTRFWEGRDFDDTMLRVETSDAYAFIEMYIASLFTRAPSVEVAADGNNQGDAELVRAVVQRFLYRQRQAMENASRLALLYPMGFMKLSPNESTDMFEKVRLRALEPWTVLLDRDADLWEEQRFVGHRYWLPIEEARQQFGAKQFTAVPKQTYFEDAARNNNERWTSQQLQLPDEYMYIEVVELYDMQFDRLYIWTPNWGSGDKLLLNEPIPVRSYDDQPLAAIVPLYYSRHPERPMDGYSAMARVYDQLLEKNVIRTFQANALRRDSRQFLYKEGSIDEEALAKITSGVDGTMIPVDAETLDGIIKEVEVGTLSSNFDKYLNYVEQDLQRGNMMAPFTQGVATKATATEVTALAQYSASEIGRLARERDEMIENLARVYVRTLLLLLEDGDRAVMSMDDGTTPRIVSPQDLDGRFRFSALDQASTPLSDSIKRQQFLQLIPVLTGLGVDPAQMRAEVVRMFDLPSEFNEPPQSEPGSGLTRPAEFVPPGAGGEGQTDAAALAAALMAGGGASQ